MTRNQIEEKLAEARAKMATATATLHANPADEAALKTLTDAADTAADCRSALGEFEDFEPTDPEDMAQYRADWDDFA